MERSAMRGSPLPHDGADGLLERGLICFLQPPERPAYQRALDGGDDRFDERGLEEARRLPVMHQYLADVGDSAHLVTAITMRSGLA